jgi:hypothetical protein
VHIGSAPEWGPAGYSDVRYYYLPDVESYYDVHTSKFIYLSNNRWVQSSRLPARYRNYDLHKGYKVVMKDYRGNTPYTHFKDYKKKYARGYRGEAQLNNGDQGNRNHSNKNKKN